jgi:hypothetical protein
MSGTPKTNVGINSNNLLALPTKARILIMFGFILEYRIL